MKKHFILLLIFFPILSFSQSNFEKTIQAGSVIINGLSVIKSNKQAPNDKSTVVICIKNKLPDKITFLINGKDKDDNPIKKDLVIQNDGKECFLEMPKGIYTYEVILPNKDTFKKGECKFDEDTTVIIKKED